MKSATKVRMAAPALLVMALTGWNVERAFGAHTTASTLDEEHGISNGDDSKIRTAASATVELSSQPPARLRRTRPHRISPDTKLAMDRSGHTRIGKASFYAKMFEGRKMADGTPMRPTGNNAASLTLPLGTTAKVTNLETGKTAIVTIRDRGPYVDGRIVDLSPATARQIGLDKRTGVTRVQVAPIAVPMPNGETKVGDGALEASNRFAGNSEWDERAGSGTRTP
jgi:rare lipoprotein A